MNPVPDAVLYPVRLRNPGRLINVAADIPILIAALKAGIAYPHGCKIGRCGACKSRLLSGHVELLKHTPFALTEHERRDGLILACRALPMTACEVAWLEANDPIGSRTPSTITHDGRLT